MMQNYGQSPFIIVCKNHDNEVESLNQENLKGSIEKTEDLPGKDGATNQASKAALGNTYWLVMLLLLTVSNIVQSSMLETIS